MTYFLLTKSLVSKENAMLRSGSVGRQERADDAVKPSLGCLPRVICPRRTPLRRAPWNGSQRPPWVRPEMPPGGILRGPIRPRPAVPHPLSHHPPQPGLSGDPAATPPVVRRTPARGTRPGPL